MGMGRPGDHNCTQGIFEIKAQAVCSRVLGGNAAPAILNVFPTGPAGSTASTGRS